MKSFHVNVSNVNVTKDIIINAVDLFYKYELKHYSDSTLFKTWLKITDKNNESKTLSLKQIHNNTEENLIMLKMTFIESVYNIENYLNENIKAEYLTIVYDIYNSPVLFSHFKSTNPAAIEKHLTEGSGRTFDLTCDRINGFGADLFSIYFNKDIFTKILQIYFNEVLSEISNDQKILTQLDVRLDDEFKNISLSQIHTNNDFEKLLEILWIDMENFMKTSESGNLNHILIKYFLPYNNSIFTDSDLKT